MNPQRLELFASGPVTPEALWAVVGDVRRLVEWTDAQEVSVTGPEPVGAGTTVVTRDGQRALSWTVTTREPRVLELSTALPQGGTLGIGVSVAREAMGARARIILAAAFQPSSTTASWRWRLAGTAALRRRFDAWTRRALAVAARDADAGDPGSNPGTDHRQGPGQTGEGG